MPLSTSNSERYIPDANWKAALLLTAVLFVAMLIGWEFFWRSKGYAPTLNDDKFLWSSVRESIQPNDVVIIGSSRGLFDLDLDELAKGLDVKDVRQLSMTGSSPLPVLENLANDINFKGTIICDVVPGLFYAPDGIPPTIKPKEWIQAYQNFSPSEKAGHYLNMFLESNLAYLKQDDLSLKELLKQADLPNRERTIVYPKLPPYFMEIDARREGKMAQKVIDDAEFCKLIQNRWPPLFTPPPFPDNPSPEEIHKRIEGNLAHKIGIVKDCAKKIRDRGGNLIFVRLPYSGNLYELESKLTSRQPSWDRLLAETDSVGVHWEDHENLKKFSCPEWSHLSAKDSENFTREIAPLIKALLSKK